ncbi:hypothetical protein CDAR_435121 [Caerostris darwini]|uniref:Uncharacterized protein n=1 Tax=Caerostris darwini TaxID=1538125 RepID=A0AAV4SFE6_9ARAC|nr:hypothetical protein CDAR_435121 [Caerostris darwini]
MQLLKCNKPNQENAEESWFEKRRFRKATWQRGTYRGHRVRRGGYGVDVHHLCSRTAKGRTLSTKSAQIREGVFYARAKTCLSRTTHVTPPLVACQLLRSFSPDSSESRAAGRFLDAATTLAVSSPALADEKFANDSHCERLFIKMRVYLEI